MCGSTNLLWKITHYRLPVPDVQQLHPGHAGESGPPDFLGFVNSDAFFTGAVHPEDLCVFSRGKWQPRVIMSNACCLSWNENTRRAPGGSAGGRFSPVCPITVMPASRHIHSSALLATLASVIQGVIPFAQAMGRAYHVSARVPGIAPERHYATKQALPPEHFDDRQSLLSLYHLGGTPPQRSMRSARAGMRTSGTSCNWCAPHRGSCSSCLASCNARRDTLPCNHQQLCHMFSALPA